MGRRIRQGGHGLGSDCNAGDLGALGTFGRVEDELGRRETGDGGWGTHDRRVNEGGKDGGTY